LLKYKIQHFYGSQEKHDLQLARLVLDTENLNEAEALENGWLFCNEWYQCRSVRINISKYKQKHKDHDIEITPYTSPAVSSTVSKIYRQYLDYKNFDEEYNIFSDLGRTEWLILKDEGEPVASTKFNRYNGGIESQFTAWNYHKPKMSIGKIIVDYEVAYAKLLNYDYLYIGQGYESGSKYKADFAGFEWWTGSEWSEDKELYKKLCTRDSQINSLNQLAEAYNESCQSLDPVENIS
jgi:hypothetical protein